MDGQNIFNETSSKDDSNYERIKTATGYSSSIIDRLRNQRDDQTLCDIILCVENQLYPVHK
jgi:hypothetical protein